MKPNLLTQMLPESMREWWTSGNDAENAVLSEDLNERLKAKRDRYDQLVRTQAIFEGATELLEAKERELRTIQDAWIFSKTTEEMLRLQGRAMALYELVMMPKNTAAEIVVVKAELDGLEALARDAA